MVFKMKFLNCVLALLALSTLANSTDLCPDEYSRYDDYCYRFFNDQKTWPEAESYCHQFQNTDGIIAHLASIHSAEENEFISSLTALGTGSVSCGTGPHTWIGLNKHQQTTFAWSDNTPIDYEHWDPGEPNSAGGGYCSNTNQAGRRSNWDDQPCSLTCPFVCKVPAGTGTPTFWTTYAGSLYRFYSDKTTWDDASTICASDSAHLVKIDNSDENHFLSTLTASSSSTGKTGPPTWIGLRLKTPEWSDGTVYQGSFDKIYCVYTNDGMRRGEWNNGNCSSELAFVCERNE